jgi:hypothetical protein
MNGTVPFGKRETLRLHTRVVHESRAGNCTGLIPGQALTANKSTAREAEERLHATV